MIELLTLFQKTIFADILRNSVVSEIKPVAIHMVKVQWFVKKRTTNQEIDII